MSTALRVLLVEDDRANAMITRAMLAQAGQRNREVYELQHVEDFGSALRALIEAEEAPFELVLLDLGLPDASGVELVVELEKRFPGLAIIVLSGAEGSHVDEESLARGAQEFLRKGGVNPDAMARAIRASLVRANLLREINASAAEHRVLFDKSPSPIWVVDAATLRIARANAAAAALHGYTAGKLAGMRFIDLQPEESEEAFRTALKDAESMPRRVWRQRTADNRALKVHLTAVEMRVDHAESLVITAQDVTAWYHSLAALRASDRRSRSLFELSPGLLYEHDLDGKLLAINTAAARVLGARPDELAGRNLRDFMPPGEAQKVVHYLQETAAHGQAETTFIVITPDGPRLLQFSARVHESPDRTTVIGHAVDVTLQLSRGYPAQSGE